MTPYLPPAQSLEFSTGQSAIRRTQYYELHTTHLHDDFKESSTNEPRSYSGQTLAPKPSRDFVGLPAIWFDELPNAITGIKSCTTLGGTFNTAGVDIPQCDEGKKLAAIFMAVCRQAL
jgi:hypothetical protein